MVPAFLLLPRHLALFEIYEIEGLILHKRLDELFELLFTFIKNFHVLSGFGKLRLELDPIRHGTPKFIRYLVSHLRLKGRYPLSFLAEIALHEVRHDGGVIPRVRRLGVGRLRAFALVGISEGSADRLGPANLGSRVEEVLSLEDVVWGKLTKVVVHGNLARQ